MKLNITIDEKTYEVEVEVAEPEAPAAMPHDLGGLQHRVGAAARSGRRRRRRAAGGQQAGE